MKRIVQVLLFVMPVLATAADESYGVSDLSFERCELREVIMRMKFESIKNGAAIAAETLAVLKPLREINSKATNPDKPIKDQLSPDDIGKFTELTQRMKSMQLSQLVESRRERDAQVIEQMVMMADREWRWRERPDEKEPNYIIYASFKLIGLMLKDRTITTPSASVCSLDLALHKVEDEAITKLNAGGARSESASVELNAILAKYRMTKIDKSRLSKQDLDKVNQLENDVIHPMGRHADFINDLENIKTMARASEILYQANKQDISFSGGAPEALGKTIQRQAANNELDEPTKLAVGLWVKINDKVPSDFAKNWEAAASGTKK